MALTFGTLAFGLSMHWDTTSKYLVSSLHHLIDYNVKKFSYNECPATTSTFSCNKLFVVSGTQFIYTLKITTSNAVRKPCILRRFQNKFTENT